MINIIPTLTVMDTKEEYERMIDNYIKSSSCIFRCNATRFENKVYIKSISILQEIYKLRTGNKFNLMLDIPCPKEKIRLGFSSKQNEILVKSNDDIIITNVNDEIDAETTIYADINTDSFELGEKIILGDGDLHLSVKEIKENALICTSLNTGSIGYKKALYSSKISCIETSDEKINKYMDLIDVLRPTFIALSFVEKKKM